jgi:antirestriction protein ArdC
MDVYKSVTDRIISALEKGTVPWKQTWKSGTPANYVTGRPYSGCNMLLLSLVPYPSPWWLTWNQIQKLGGSVRKGEKATPVIYSAHVDKTKSYQDPETSEEWISINEYSLLKTYLVWNIDQTAGIPEKSLPDNHQNETCVKRSSGICRINRRSSQENHPATSRPRM